MSDYQDSTNSFEELETLPPPREPKAGPKPFTIAIIVIAAIFVISVIGLILVLLLKGPQQSSAVKEQAEKINTQNTQVALAATGRANEVAALAKTLEAGQKAPAPTATFTAAPSTPTAVIAVPTATKPPATATIASDMLTRTAVVATQVAQGTLTPGTGGAGVAPGVTPQATSTALPTTGFMDEVGLPSLFGLALVLIAVVILARRLRLSAR